MWWKRDILALSTENIKKMTVQLAVKRNIPHPFGKERAGRKWLFTFPRRHRQSFLRKTQTTSTARLEGGGRDKVTRFSSVLNFRSNYSTLMIQASLWYSLRSLSSGMRVTDFFNICLITVVTLFEANRRICASISRRSQTEDGEKRDVSLVITNQEGLQTSSLND